MKRILKQCYHISGLLFLGIIVILNLCQSLSQDDRLVYEPNQNSVCTVVDPTAFISVWNTGQLSAGSSGSNQVRLPLIPEGIYNFTVEWGDTYKNSITSWNQSEITHTYDVEGVYTVVINGTIIGWRFNELGDCLKILEIQRWGCLQLGNKGGYFSGCVNLIITANDRLNLTETTDLSRMFRNCTMLGENGNLDTWDVSDVIDMEGMFSYAYSFNQPIGKWNVSNVIDMSFMFYESWSFNQLIGTWNILNVQDLGGMFWGASSFNQPIGAWNVSKVTNMNCTFYHASSFNQSLEAWNVSNVRGMECMFYKAFSFNQPIGTWNVSNVKNMRYIFSDASTFNQPIEIWDVSHVNDMSAMFYEASSFNRPLEMWNVSSVKYMGMMFTKAQAFNQSIGSWNVARVLSMTCMFSWAKSFNQPIGTWDVSQVTDMSSMFYMAIAFDQPLGMWNVSNVFDMSGMFTGVTLSTINYNHLLLGWSQLELRTHVTFDGGNSKYSQNATVARKILINTYKWIIIDGGLDYALPNSISVYSPPLFFGIMSIMAILYVFQSKRRIKFSNSINN